MGLTSSSLWVPVGIPTLDATRALAYERNRPMHDNRRHHPELDAHLPSRILGSLGDRLRNTPTRYRVLSLGGMIAYLLLMRFAGDNRPEQYAITVVVVLFAFWSDATRRFLVDLLPFLLFGLLYDLTHLTQPLIRHLHVHVEEPYLFDKRFFGIPSPTGILTPNEFFERHHWPAVDFVTGLSYIVFIYWSVFFAFYLSVFRRDEQGRRLLSRFGWSFLFLNVAGIATYYVYPAAPPWYVSQYGLGPADMSATASAAAAARWDELTGIPYFSVFYGRSADVFGAIPSLHVAYPLITFLFGLELKKRWFDVSTFLLFLLVCFAAVYLNHHYVLDVLLGCAYSLAAWGVAVAIERRRRATAAAFSAEPAAE